MEDGRSAFKILTVKPKRKRPSGRPRRRCEDNIRIDLKINRCQYEEWGLFGSGYGLLGSPCKCGIEPPVSISHGVSPLVSIE